MERNGNLLFTELTMAVILGVLMTEAATTLTAGSIFISTRSILLIVALLIFLENFIVLKRYHEKLRVSYNPIYLVTDLVSGLLFIVFAQMQQKSVSGETVFQYSLLVAALLFIFGCIRQVLMLASIENKIATLNNLDMSKITVIAPMVVTVVGAGLSIFIFLADKNSFFLGLTVLQWCWLSLSIFLTYFLFTHIFELKTRDEKQESSEEQLDKSKPDAKK